MSTKFTLPAGEKRQLYVNRNRAKANSLLKSDVYHQALPVLVVHVYNPYHGAINLFCDEVEIKGPSRFVSARSEASMLTPLGPAMWVETEAELELTII